MYGGGMYGGGMYGGGMGGPLTEQERQDRALELMELIEDTIVPDSWYDAGGEGTITSYQGKKLIVLQTREIHNQIEELIKGLRKALGNQVSIEARFLLVSENFLEDIGLDIGLAYRPGGKWLSPIVFEQGTYGTVVPEATKVQGSWGEITPSLSVGGPGGGRVTWGSTAAPVMDDLEVWFLVRATQAHRDATSLTAPKVTVLSGESASLTVQRQVPYALPPDVQTGVSAGAFPGGGYQTGGIFQNINWTPTGSALNITPTISPDRRHVLLDIVTNLQDILSFRTLTVEGPVGTEGEVVEYNMVVPETETSQVMTRVTVPDGGTLLLGGQRVTAEVVKEAGVPVLSKIPLLNRVFSNRSTVKDQKILLILVKPTIILQEEADAEAIAAMEEGSF